LFCWRRRWSLSVLYLLVLGAVGAGMALILFRLPHGVDLGLTIAARAVAYHRSFAAVELAQEDLAAGHLDDAERRLRSFLAEHTATQPGQLATHAVTDGHLLLAEVYLAQGRSGRALKRLREMAERTPKNYYVWFRLGRVAEEAGDLPRAREALHRAFLLALDHPEVTEAYLGVLKEQVAHEQILWVADHFQRAQQRAAPQVEIKVGAALC
jgi:tetratricopeptide (TPR) repeat protein